MKRIRLEYQRHKATGLFAATSPDLEGFLVMGKTFDEVLAEIPTVAAALIRNKTGEDVIVNWSEQPASSTGFAPLASEVEVCEPA